MKIRTVFEFIVLFVAALAFMSLIPFLFIAATGAILIDVIIMNTSSWSPVPIEEEED